MINIVTQIDDTAIHRLLSVYSESMDDMNIHFVNDAEMIAAYTSFLQDFVSNPKQQIIVETNDNAWVSALRVIETIEGNWFLEAVETKPEERNKGFGEKLLRHSIAYLKSIGMVEITCTIAKNNLVSQALHEKCGFIPTNEVPMNCWGELEKGTILYRFVK